MAIKIGNELNQTSLQYIGLMAVLLLPIALLCRLEINGVCLPDIQVCVNLIDGLGIDNRSLCCFSTLQFSRRFS